MSLLAVATAQARLLASVTPVPLETLSLSAALGRWTARPVVAARTQPAADLSAMDGYAVRFTDLPGPWRVIGESAAGRPFSGAIGPNEATRIFTGAAMPAGADTVVVQEDAARDGDRLTLAGDGPSAAGRHVRPRGLDFATGDVLIAPGERLTPPRLAVAAAGGVGTVAVHRPIRVAIVASGDELVEPGQAVDGVDLPESNRLLLRSMLAGLPVEIVDLGILPDRLDVLAQAFRAVSADLLVTTGGASVGDHDLIRPALEAAGAQIDFWRVALRPGRPMIAGRRGPMLVLGLPGNPVSAFVTATLFVKPVIAALAGAADPLPQSGRAILGEDLPANNDRADYLRAVVAGGRVTVSGVQDSSMLLTLARSNCLLLRAAGAPRARAGDSAEILMIA